MATKRLTGQVIETFKHNNTISYSKDQVGGSVHALGNYAVKATGNGEVGLVGAGEAILGELMEVSRDGYCSVTVEGQGLQFKMGAASGVTVGNRIAGATGDSVGGQTGGYVVNAGADVDGKGHVTDVAGTAKNSVVTVNIP